MDTITEEKMTDTSKTKKQRGLGRGLGALFEDEESVYPQPGPDGHTPGLTRTTLGVDQIRPGKFQPRSVFDKESIRELAASIAVHGILQPLVVRPMPGFEHMDAYEIIAGERRWRAAQEAQLHEVPVIIGNFDDTAVLEIGLIENLQREDLNPLDEAEGYKRLAEEFGHTQEKIAETLGKSRSHVANMLRLLNLPEKIRMQVKQSKLTAGHARALAAMEPESAEKLAQLIIEKGLSVRETEAFAAANSGRPPRGKKKGAGAARSGKDVDTLALEEEVGNAIGAKVSIDMKPDGAGSMTISFKTLDQLDEVLHRLSHNPGRPQKG